MKKSYWYLRSLASKGAATVVKPVRKIAWFLLPPRLKSFILAYREEVRFADNSTVTVYCNELDTYPYFPGRRELVKQSSGYRHKFTLISTTLNEQQNAREWLQSLLDQSRPPDEVVIVDGGSSDQTVKLIEEFAEQAPFPVSVLVQEGCNISAGRNIAVRNSACDIIACTDFGGTLDRDWLKLLLQPFEQDDISVSFGRSEMDARTIFQQVSRRQFTIDIDKIDAQAYLPSSRNIAFTREIWQKAGGYPEWLTDAGEDTLFDLRIKQISAEWAFVPEAIVTWRGPDSFKQQRRTIQRYAQGDGETGIFASKYWEHVERLVKMLAVSILALLALALLPFFEIGSIIITGMILLYLILFSISFVAWIPRELRTIKHATVLLASNLNATFAKAVGFSLGVKNQEQVTRRKAEIFRGRLDEIIHQFEGEIRDIIIYPPTHDWGFMFQRPQQIARSFARSGYLYFYCTKNEIQDTFLTFTEVEPHLFVSPVPVETFEKIKSPIVYVGAARYANLLQKFTNAKVIYDHYDDIRVSGAAPQDHRTLLREANVVVTSSRVLLDAALAHRKDLVLVPNGVDYEYIQSQHPDSSQAPAEDMQPILARKQPIIGYSGALAEWFDYELLKSVAKKCRDYQFVLIGVNYDQSLDSSGLLDIHNIHWLGLKSYERLFPYLWHFDVAIIPFKVNDITRATSPIKLFEYFACRKPVISTPLPECQKYEEVLIADTSDAFARAIEEGLQYRLNPDYIRRIANIAQENTWDERVGRIIKKLQ